MNEEIEKIKKKIVEKLKKGDLRGLNMIQKKLQNLKNKKMNK